MDVQGITKKPRLAMETKGFRMAITNIKHLADLRREIGSLYKQGLLDEVFYRENLENFEFKAPSDIASIIITAAPQPRQRVNFQYQGKYHHFTIPPTYSLDSDKVIEKIVSRHLEPEGYRIWPAVLPLKLLSVRSGLARYGKNNITYIEGMGSFYRLKAFLSDIPPTEDNWLEPQSLKQCQTCNACIKKCPTGAITPERFLIRAEKCLTFHNERANEFPAWIEPSWHNSLIGCMVCQSVCPVNKEVIGWSTESETFTQQETESLLQATSRKQLPLSVAKKLKRLYLLEDWELVPRNLKVLLDRPRG
jgi:epoxyqueuosine reductase